jgi:hypothetical protein
MRKRLLLFNYIEILFTNNNRKVYLFVEKKKDAMKVKKRVLEKERITT